MEKIDLKPCPFCGKQPRVIEDNSYGECQIFCVCELEPDVSAPIGEMKKAAEIWNTRFNDEIIFHSDYWD